MKIGVCVKVTPDTDTRIKVSGGSIDLTGAKMIVSPYDAFAIEEAVQTKEQKKLGFKEVILFNVGTDKHLAQLRGSGLAVGADRAVLVTDPAAIDSDALGIARSLAAAIQQEDCRLVFCGKQALDDDNVQVPAMVAELLGWPLVSMVSEFSTDGSTFSAERNVGGGIREVVQGPLPAVITAERGLNSPRYAKLPAIMKAKRKKVAKKSVADLGLSADDVANGVVQLSAKLPPARSKGRILQGDADTTARELVRLLREEAKVI